MKPSPLFPQPERDDQSTHGHRQLIGWAGMMMPFLVWLMAGWRPTLDLPRWKVLESISVYYYTGAVAVFVGMLVALAAFLMTYRGYDNRHLRLDRIAATAASFAALGVAFFPTQAPATVAAPSWWMPWMRTIHYLSAVALFSAFAFFALFLFPQRSDQAARSRARIARDKRVRNVIYRSCGVVILLSMAWAGIAGALGGSIFWPESTALVAFATAWLVKGRVVWTVASVGRNAAYYGTNPRQLVRAMRAAGRP